MDLKFCKDCKWCEFIVSSPGISNCVNPNLINLVDGTIDSKFCSFLRGDEEKCGRVGKWWEEHKWFENDSKIVREPVRR